MTVRSRTASIVGWIVLLVVLYFFMLVAVEVLTPSAWDDDPGPLLKSILKTVLAVALGHFWGRAARSSIRGEK